MSAREHYVVFTGCEARIPLAVISSEKEAYYLANALDGIVEPLPLYKTSREARQSNSDIAYEVERTRGNNE